MIKLIASDLDGTLVPEGTPDINPDVFDVVRRLRKKGITFVAASGRQYISMRSVLAPIEEEILFVSDNGACEIYRGELQNCRRFDREILREIITYVREQKDLFMLAATMDGAYTDSRDEELIEWIIHGYKQNLHRVEDLLETELPVVKVSVYCKNTDAANLGIPAREKFQGRASVMVSGDHWVDFMAADVDKGSALGNIQKQLGILPEETMAFGDNNNDLGMLGCAEESYAAANAREDVKKAAKYIMRDNTHDAVVNVLKTLL